MNVMLAKQYKDQDPTGWLISEKLDGVRSIWTGSELLSRNGKKFFAPEWFTRQLPAGIPLDGELYIGRGEFQSTVSVVKKKTPVDSEWDQIRYMVFDAPEIPGVFENRIEFCAGILTECAIASVVEHRACKCVQDLNSFFDEICAAHGEGVMCRKAGSAYENRRSDALLKYKPFETDEAIVIGQETGKGKFKDMVGALILKWKGIVFKVGSGLTDQLRNDPPANGVVVTFGFCGLTDAGVPRFPTFIGDRCYE
ncbi:MAG: DNA ligase [Pseudomonadota bacterium]